jgi:signal transduction histidine kinase/CheY-like chemotaxis protein
MVLVINFLMITTVTASFVVYIINYRSKITTQNQDDISHLNLAAAKVSSSVLNSQNKRLSDTAFYVKEKLLNAADAMTYIYESNSDRPTTYYELVASNFKGYIDAKTEDGTAFKTVNYSDAVYSSFNSIFSATDRTETSGVRTTTEFTDYITAYKSFAVYEYIDLPSTTGGTTLDQHYTLMAVSRSQIFADLIQPTADYQGLATILTNTSGDYVFGSSDFKSDNLFHYFYDANNLTLDERNDLLDKFNQHFSDETKKETNLIYKYKNSKGQDCIFICTSVKSTTWVCVTSVPLSSYKNNNPNFGFITGILVLLTLLLVFNVMWMTNVNKHLKLSVEKEKEANAAKTDFLSRMSHDIRTPLNVISGSALLARREHNTPATEKYLGNIENSSKFLLSLVNDVLDINKVGAGKMELRFAPSSLKNLGDSMASIIGPLCEDKNINFKVEVPQDGTQYMCDSVRLNQIFFNILSNSVKFTPAGGHVSLSVTPQDVEDTRTILHFVAKDDGQGMSKEFQKKMFDPFTQEGRNGDAAVQGTGLGLAIVHNLVNLMGGIITVESEINEGTTFKIDIPVQKATKNDLSLEEENDVPLDILKGKKILLVEDNQINASIATTLLKDKGIEATTASNGEIALEMFRGSELKHYDAILMDMRMPVMNGIDATKSIRSLPRPDAKTVPIIAMTANAYDEDVKICIEAGMNAHIAKPIDPNNMYATIARQIAKAQKQ